MFLDLGAGNFPVAEPEGPQARLVTASVRLRRRGTPRCASAGYRADMVADEREIADESGRGNAGAPRSTRPTGGRIECVNAAADRNGESVWWQAWTWPLIEQNS